MTYEVDWGWGVEWGGLTGNNDVINVQYKSM
jgi:hypothetical protein